MELKTVKVHAVAKNVSEFNKERTRNFRGPGEKEWYKVSGADDEAINANFTPDLISRGNTIEFGIDDVTKHAITFKLIEKGEPQQKEFKKGGSWRQEVVQMTHDQLDKAMEKSMDVVMNKLAGKTQQNGKEARLHIDDLKDTGMSQVIISLFIAKTRSVANGGDPNAKSS